MVRRTRPHLPLLALLLTASLLSAGEGLRPLDPDRLAVLRSRQAERADRITRSLEASSSALGLGALDGLRAYNRLTDAYGATHVRFHQTYRGVEVFGGAVLGHMDAEGQVLAPHATVQTGIDLAPATLLGNAAVQAIVEANLPAQGRLQPLRIQTVVFPTKYQDGIKFTRGPGGRMVIDRVYSVPTPRRSDPYCWAFKISAMQLTGSGPVVTDFILDGVTGDLLKKWDGGEHMVPDSPAIGTGVSQYNGTVTLDTQYLGTPGVFLLRDTTRATGPWPNPGNLISCPEWDGIGSLTVCFDPSGPNSMTSGTTPYTSAQDTWGDGLGFDWNQDHPAEDFASVGQTAAVDAHYALQCTWDYYERVLGRTGGIDGMGGSVINAVHECLGDEAAWNVASWDPDWFMVNYGDGAATGPCACLDVACHELSHGVMTYTANLSEPSGFVSESACLNEANSDIHATMIKYYQWGAHGQGTVVPDGTTEAPGGHNAWTYLWTTGPQLSLDGVTPLRWLYKPSKDGNSHDAWFDGMYMDDPHYGEGPGTRAFFFLSQGASSDPSQDTYSPYLPSGMEGIGNDKAIHIWYHAMATKVTDPNSGFLAIRAALLESAAELYPGGAGADSPETAAVRNAFAAVNVGAPEGGKDPIRLVFPDNPASPFFYQQTVVAPARVPTRLPAPTVSNATDTSVTWSLGGLSYEWPQGGTMEDGAFVAPMANCGDTWPVMATSAEDPLQFAVDIVYGVSLDGDSDTVTDACDMAAFALAYGRSDIYTATNLYGAPWTDDICIELFLEGFHNAFDN
jgi:Zn-dependent metalloprotease